MEPRSLGKKESSFSLSSEKSGKGRKLKATRIMVLLHQFHCGIDSIPTSGTKNKVLTHFLLRNLADPKCGIMKGHNLSFLANPFFPMRIFSGNFSRVF